MAKRNEKFVRMKLHVTVEGEEHATIEGCVDLQGMTSKVLERMAPESIDGLLRASVLKLIPSVRATRPTALRDRMLRVVRREEELARKRAADEEVIVVEEDAEE